MLNAYLLFNGHCEEAFKLYAKVLGGTIRPCCPTRAPPRRSTCPPSSGRRSCTRR
jgi:uncharacterized glyoxalase superfamily protein PhnB